MLFHVLFFCLCVSFPPAEVTQTKEIKTRERGREEKNTDKNVQGLPQNYHHARVHRSKHEESSNIRTLNGGADKLGSSS